jgi:hypothetical protein
MAMRITSFLIAAAVDGRPGTRRLVWSHFCATQPTVPGEQRRQGHREHLSPPAAAEPTATAPQATAGRLDGNEPADLAAKDRVLVAARQKLGLHGHPIPGQYCQAVQQAANEQVEAEIIAKR